MKKHYCDQTNEPINGGVVKVIIMPPENGYSLNKDDSNRNMAIHDKDFSSLNAAADYIKQNCPGL